MAGCRISSATHYQTPLYDLEIDQKSEFRGEDLDLLDGAHHNLPFSIGSVSLRTLCEVPMTKKLEEA